MTNPIDPNWHATGISQEIDVDKFNGPYENNPNIMNALQRKEHFWVILTAYHVKYPERLETESFHADRENLVSISGPGCLFCENPYSPKLAMMKCRGGL